MKHLKQHMTPLKPRIAYTLIDTGIDESERLQFANSIRLIKSRFNSFFPHIFEIKDKPQNDEVDILIEWSINNPLMDERSLETMIQFVWGTKHSLFPVDDIPGTAPTRVVCLSGSQEAEKPFYYDTQPRFSTNFNIRRPNRRHIFNRLFGLNQEFTHLPFDSIIKIIEAPETIDLILSYGESLPLQTYQNCPYCESTFTQKLYPGTGNSICGFLTKNSSIYSHCHGCGLTYMNKQLARENLFVYYQDYSYLNASSERELECLYDNLTDINTSHFSNYVAVKGEILSLGKDAKIADLGAGRGEFVAYARNLRPDIAIHAFDWRMNVVAKNVLEKRNVHCHDSDLVKATNHFKKKLGPFDLITAWEVVEHLKVEDLSIFIKSIADSLSPNGKFALSTPDFNDPHCRAQDFWTMAPGEHITVLSKDFLGPLLESCGLKIVAEKHESVMTKLPNRWFRFGADTNHHFSTKAVAQIIEDILADDILRERYRQKCRDSNIGSELILVMERI